MAVINTGLLTKGLRSEFFNRFEQAPTYYRDVATRIASTSDHESYRWLGTVPAMREWGTGRVARGLRTESYSVENLKYESTLEVDRDEIADDQTGQIRVRIGELADAAANHKDYLVAQLLINGESEGYHSYDGVPFFSDMHASGASGYQANKIDTSAADADDPTTDEFKTSIKQAIVRMLGFKDDQGAPMPMSASGLMCVVPPPMYFAAVEAIKPNVVDGTSNVLESIARVIAFPWLGNPRKWYLLKNNGVVRPFIFQDREAVEFNALTDDSEEGFKREKFLYGVRARYRMAYGYWQFAVRAEFVED